MKIKFWGVRGSIPVSGKQYLKYGGDTTCVEITTADGETIIIDAGSAIRKVGNKLLKEKKNIFHLLITHTHWDHLLGFPFFKQIYQKQNIIHLYGNASSKGSIETIFSDVMKPPNFPVDYANISCEMNYKVVNSDSFKIGSVKIETIELSHPNGGNGYKFTENGKVFVFLTDNEITYTHPGGKTIEEYIEFSKDADLFVHDSEYTREDYKYAKTWGHSVYNDVLDFALKANVKSYGLCHHNQDRTDKEIDAIVKDCRKTISEQETSLNCFAIESEMEFTL